MIGAAVLGTENLVATRFGGVEPKLRVTPRQQVLLDAQGRKVKAVNHVLGDHVQPHRAPNRHVQGIDLALAAGMLEFPHPLLGHHLNLHGIHRRRAHFVVELRRDQIDDHRADEGQHDPGHFDLHAAARAMVASDLGALAVAYCEQNREYEHRHDEDRHHAGERPDQPVDAARMLGCGLRPQAQKIIVHRRPPACVARATATAR